MPIQLIHEGLCPQYTPEVTYILQGKKVLFTQGTPALSESCDPKRHGWEVVESVRAFDLLYESSESQTAFSIPEALYRFEGIYQRSDVRNVNQRYYRRKIWEKLIGDKQSYLMRLLESRGMLGHLEHPKDGQMDGNLAAILTTALFLRDDGVVWGVGEALDTEAGEKVQCFIRRGIRWGVSSRGKGEILTDGEVNPETYICETWDAVTKPSTPGSEKMVPVVGRAHTMITVPESIEKLRTSLTESEATNQALAESLLTVSEAIVQGKLPVADVVRETALLLASRAGLKLSDPLYESAIVRQDDETIDVDAIFDAVSNDASESVSQQVIDERVGSLLLPLREELTESRQQVVEMTESTAAMTVQLSHAVTELDDTRALIKTLQNENSALQESLVSQRRQTKIASSVISTLSRRKRSATLGNNNPVLESAGSGQGDKTPTPAVTVSISSPATDTGHRSLPPQLNESSEKDRQQAARSKELSKAFTNRKPL